MSIEYRRLAARDIQLALGMNADFRERLIDRDAVEKFLNDERNWLFAAIHADKVIGFAYGYRMARMDGAADMLYIHEVGVADAVQRRGVGTAMMRALLDDARRALIECSPDQTATRVIAEKCGFVLKSESPLAIYTL